MGRNVALYPWFKFFQNLLFWQAVWFLYVQAELSAAEAIALYAVFDIATTTLEVPSGYMSDKLGRRVTLILAAIAGVFGALAMATGDSFAVFALGQVFWGASIAFASGTDSALLYESLDADGRADEIEPYEIRGWRFTYAGLALSAPIGGLMAYISPTFPFWSSMLAFSGMLWIAWRFAEPTRQERQRTDRADLIAALRHPTLMWLFGLGIMAYSFSHIPYVFGQPFIIEALRGQGWEGQATWISGCVTAIMMVMSMIASAFAPKLRERVGFGVMVLPATLMQVGLVAVLALTNAAWAIALLFLRMVPDAFSVPFIQARIQPLISSETRATYLSLRSFCARIVFAASLFLAAGSTSDAGLMPYDDIQSILGWYVLAGLTGWLCLAATLRKVG